MQPVEFSNEERAFLLQTLDRVPVTGLVNMQLAVISAGKIQNSALPKPVDDPAGDESS